MKEKEYRVYSRKGLKYIVNMNPHVANTVIDEGQVTTGLNYRTWFTSETENRCGIMNTGNITISTGLGKTFENHGFRRCYGKEARAVVDQYNKAGYLGFSDWKKIEL